MLKLMGLGKCQASLAAYGVAAGKKIFDLVDEKAEDVRSDMETLAAVNTGEMQVSIDIETIAKKKDIYILAVGPSDDLKSGVPGIPYSVWVETGKGRGPAQPFVRPAGEMNKPFVIKL